jgi:hypothetical protein
MNELLNGSALRGGHFPDSFSSSHFSCMSPLDRIESSVAGYLNCAISSLKAEFLSELRQMMDSSCGLGRLINELRSELCAKVFLEIHMAPEPAGRGAVDL